MRDSVILINDRLVSLSHTTHSSSLNPQLLLSLVHPSICVRVLVRVVGDVGTVECFFFVCFILVTEHLILLVPDICESRCVHELVDHYRYHVNEGVWVKINI